LLFWKLHAIIEKRLPATGCQLPVKDNRKKNEDGIPECAGLFVVLQVFENSSAIGRDQRLAQRAALGKDREKFLPLCRRPTRSEA